MKLSNKALLGIAVVLSLFTSVLVYNYLKGAAVHTPPSAVPVAVAKVDIPPKTKITAEMLQEMQVPAEYIQPGAIQDMTTVVGLTTREHIVSGEQVTDRRLIIEGKSVGFTGLIPRDRRALTVAVSEVSGVAGFVKPGDYVDVIMTFDSNVAGDNLSHVALQNILVLASNRQTEAKETAVQAATNDAVKSTTVTLAVTPEQAAHLTLAEDKGKVRLALRPYLPTNGIEITNVVTPKDIVGIHQSPVAPSDNAQQSQSEPPAARQPSYEERRPQPSNGQGIQLIRGTKIETVAM